jgi:hypothetical protein
MSTFRKTLPLPPPGKNIGEALQVGLRQPQRKTPSTGAERHKSVAPRPPKMSSSNNDLRRSPKPGGRRSLPPPPRSPDFGDLAPQPEPRAANWMAHARSLLESLEEALRSGASSWKVQTSVERAYAAWNLEGATQRQIAHVAHLVRRAYDAIRATSRSGLEAAYADCARVLHLGLPTVMRRRVPIEVVVEAVRTMRREADRWIAIVDTTMLFVGWTEANRMRAADAIRQALQEFPPEQVSAD